MKISAFVVSYNREETIETCLRSLRFVDELIVVDKSSSDGTRAIAVRFADRVIVVPWSPTVEETRSFALEQCRYDSVIYLDDDECLSPQAIRYLNKELRYGSADLFALPCRQYILGRHDESAYYWPERHIKAFRRGAMSFKATVHGGFSISEGATVAEPGLNSGICYHNISHPDAFTWIEKTNRYTSQRDRFGWVKTEPVEILSEARERFDYWSQRCDGAASSYAQAVVLLRTVYDLTDIVKRWEQKDGLDGNVLFAETCQNLRDEYDRLEHETGINTSLGPGRNAPIEGQATVPSILESDKHFWHRYSEVYLRAFVSLGRVARIFEFGIFHGASLRWLRSRFPNAAIVAADILPLQADWPQDDHMSYRQVDQADRKAVSAMLSETEEDYDLMIEDGSHIPEHQATCLIEGLRHVRPGGLFILEDIGTSHPLHTAFGHHSLIDGRQAATALHVLLAIKHRKEAGLPPDREFVSSLSDPGYFTPDEIDELFGCIGDVDLYRRNVLPLRCYACGGTDFDYVSWQCRCGTLLFEPADSMAALVWKTAGAPQAAARPVYAAIGDAVPSFDAVNDFGGRHPGDILLGSYGVETSGETKYVWVGQSAKIALLKRGATSLHVTLFAPMSTYRARDIATPLTIDITVDGTLVKTVSAVSDQLFALDIPLPEATSGFERDVTLTANQAIPPSASDERSLSFIVSRIALE